MGTPVGKEIWFRNLCARNGLEVTRKQAELLAAYVERLLEWNKKINLISRKDEENIWERHIVGAVSFLFSVRLANGASILDLGTGGGLPGIPLAVLLPSARITLVDSIQKKITAVNEILVSMNLGNVATMCGRAEDLGRRKDLQSTFDYVIARAVGPAHQIAKWSRPFLRRGNSHSKEDADRRPEIPVGAILLLKGGNLDREIQEVRTKLKPRVVEQVRLRSEMEDGTIGIDKILLVVQP